MNNKGQSLIAFILLLPVIFVLTTGIWELGNIAYINSKTEEEITSIIKYGLKHIEEENIEENKIIIKIKYNYQNLYSKYIKPIEIEKTYIGKKENDKIIIEKEG